MRLYNSLTKQKEPLETLTPETVSMYVCGPTTYDYLHIGNARPLVVFDTVARYLRHKGYTVNHVQNFTDVDDKIIARAKERGEDTAALSQRYIAEANADMERLGIDTTLFQAQPTVTDEMSAIIEMIADLIAKGHAYETRGNVYFHSPSYADYGVLKNINQDELQTRLDDDTHGKKHPTDFVLWKAKKDGEPSFDSPWGAGRPGWHIECSAMIKKHLGDTIDIHGGGGDLMFPHHENEIAQSVCANHAPLARYFMHNGFITIDNDKMSKSSGNFLTIREIGEQHGYAVLRFFLLSSHYRSALSYSDEAIASAKIGLERISTCMNHLRFLGEQATQTEQTDSETHLLEQAVEILEAFDTAMDDDFNTSLAFSSLFELITFINTHTREGGSEQFVTKLSLLLDILLEIIGISELLADDATDDADTARIEDLIAERTQAKKDKDFARADTIRGELTSMGVAIEDTRQGVKWRYL